MTGSKNEAVVLPMFYVRDGVYEDGGRQKWRVLAIDTGHPRYPIVAVRISDKAIRSFTAQGKAVADATLTDFSVMDLKPKRDEEP